MAEKNTNMSRIGWIDAAKGVAILLVMWGHVTQGYNPVAKWLSMFDVTAFLMIAGFMNGMKSKTSFSRAAVKKNLIPYFWFSVAAICMRCIYCVLRMPDNLLRDFADYFYRAIVGYGIFALWFIPSYIIGQFIFFAIMKNTNNWLRAICNLLLPIAAFCAEKLLFVIQGKTSTFVYDIIYYPVAAVFRGLACGFFIYIGYLLYIAFEKYGKKLNPGGYVCLSTVILIVLFPLAELNEGNNFSTLEYGNHPVLLYICGILGSVGLMSFCYGIYRWCSFKFLEFCGRNSLILMGTHMSLMLTTISIKLFSVANNMLFHGVANTYISSTACTVIMLLIEYPIILLLNGKLRFFMTGEIARKGEGGK